MPITLNKVDLSLAGVNLSRLESKDDYSAKYNDIPNHVLPVDLIEKLSAVYEALSGNEFSDEVKTFTVLADENRRFRALYTPSVMADSANNQLILEWGKEKIALGLEDGGVTSEHAPKLRWGILTDTFGKYKRNLLKLTLPINGEQYVVSFPIRMKRVEEGQEQADSDTLNFLVENDTAEFLELLVDIADRKSGNYMTGYSAKAGQLGLGTYRATSYSSKDHPTYGTMYFIQMQLVDGDDFSFETRVPATDDSGEFVLTPEGKRVYEPAEVTAGKDDLLIVKANTGLKNLILSKPIMTQEDPVMVTVVSHGEFNGHRTARVEWSVTKYRQEQGALNPSF